MYSDKELSAAVEAGIFTDDSVSQFRAFTLKEHTVVSDNEEQFRLVTGFNDIFVVIACLLLLSSMAWLGGGFFGLLAVIATSWGLAEVFVRKRKMALPAIVLLITFMGGVGWLGFDVVKAIDFIVFIISMGGRGSLADLSLFDTSYKFSGDTRVSVPFFIGFITVIAARLHWLRFAVPITVAVAVGSVVGCTIAIFVSQFPNIKQWYVLFLIGGFISFLLAMYWDSQDVQRKTQKSDIAFWLHLLAAPLIVHSIFSMLGVFDGTGGIFMALVVVSFYILLAIISIIIDRRALMVSSLVYVLYALTKLFEVYGMVHLSLAVSGVLIGSMLLLLSAFWQSLRQSLLRYFPESIKKYLPA